MPEFATEWTHSSYYSDLLDSFAILIENNPDD